MKNFLLSFLVLLMFTPGLACAGCLDFHKPQMAKDMPCCPKSKTTHDMGGMICKGCIKVDWQQANDLPLLKKVDIAKYTFPFIEVQALNKELSFTGNNGVRGPPFERLSSLSPTYPPLFLTTQRLRI